MNDLEIFDKNGNQLHISDIITNFLKENLSIEISTSKENDFGNRITVIEVSILLDGKEISKSNDTIY